MLMPRGTVWHLTRWFCSFFKKWPHLTSDRKWPYIIASKHKIYQQLYIFLFLASRGVIWDTTRQYWMILNFWPHLTPHVTPIKRGQNESWQFQKKFLPLPTSKPTITQKRQKWTWALLAHRSSIAVVSIPGLAGTMDRPALHSYPPLVLK